MVSRAGVGPKPCPITKMTTEMLIEKLRELTSQTIKETAVALSHQMNEEDGVMSALEHFWFALPMDSMICTIGLIMGKSLLAKYRMQPGLSMFVRSLTYITVSQEVASVLAAPRDGKAGRALRKLIERDWLIPYGSTTYALRQRGGSDNLVIALLTSLGEFFWWAFYSLLQIYRVPDR